MLVHYYNLYIYIISIDNLAKKMKIIYDYHRCKYKFYLH